MGLRDYKTTGGQGHIFKGIWISKRGKRGKEEDFRFSIFDFRFEGKGGVLRDKYDANRGPAGEGMGDFTEAFRRYIRRSELERGS